MQNEIEKFEQFAHNWWNIHSGEFKLLHQINPLRLEFIKQSLEQHFKLIPNQTLKSLDILDVGCGGGIASIPMAKLGCNVIGIDPSKKATEAANLKAKELELSNIAHICCLPEEFAPSKQFDVILCLDMVEHIQNLAQFIDLVVKLVKPDGAIIISTINKTIKAFLGAIIVAEYIFGMLPKGTHHYEKFVSPAMLENQFAKHGFNIKKMLGIKRDILGKWDLSENIDINYLVYISAT